LEKTSPEKYSVVQIMLEKLAGISSLAASKPMIGVLLKLLGFCLKLRANRQLLLSPGMGTIPVLLNTLKLCLAAGETLMATGQPFFLPHSTIQ